MANYEKELIQHKYLKFGMKQIIARHIFEKMYAVLDFVLQDESNSKASKLNSKASQCGEYFI